MYYSFSLLHLISVLLNTKIKTYTVCREIVNPVHSAKTILSSLNVLDLPESWRVEAQCFTYHHV